MSATATTAWENGRFDSRTGKKRILFGRMYEDVAIELDAFRPGGHVFCIASAGSTALALCDHHDVVACDINPAQLAYARERIEGAPAAIGTAEKVMGFGRALAPLAGWRESVLREFLALDDLERQRAFWRDHLDTWRFRTGFDGLLSITGLRAVYARELLSFLPPRFGAVLRARMGRCFDRHPNSKNGYAHALLLGGGDTESSPSPQRRSRIQLVESDALGYLASCAPASFDAFTLSNILDGASPAYREQLLAAVKRASTPDGVVVLRSFAEPADVLPTNRAHDDRSMLWGVVDVRRVSEL